jgi:hypothetical protein
MYHEDVRIDVFGGSVVGHEKSTAVMLVSCEYLKLNEGKLNDLYSVHPCKFRESISINQIE